MASNDNILNYNLDEGIGTIVSVDTGMALAIISDDAQLSQLQVNQLLAIKSPHPGRHIIGMIVKIFRKQGYDVTEDYDVEDEEDVKMYSFNQIRIVFIGEFIDKYGDKSNVFRRNVTAVPSVDAACYKIEGERLSNLMKTISSGAAAVAHPLSLGKYTMDESSEAFLDGDKLFQRHAAIVGSTGSGKSYSVARIVEQMADLPNANTILFDIHGEYSTNSFKKEGIVHYRIATPSD